MDLAALRTTAAGLVFNECGGWGGWRGTGSLGVGELLVCERPVDGFSWSPPGRALQADTMRNLVVLEDVVLRSAFTELLPAGRPADRRRLTGGQLRPTDRAMAARSARTSSSEEASRLSDDEERLLTKRSMANTSMVKKHLFGSGKAEKKNKFFMIQTVTSWKQTSRSRSKVISASQRSPPQKKRGVKRRAARAAQKKTSAAQRHAKWTSGEGAHLNSEYLG